LEQAAYGSRTATDAKWYSFYATMKRRNLIAGLLAVPIWFKARLFGRPQSEIFVSGDKMIFPNGDEIDLPGIGPESRQQILAGCRELWANLPKP